MDRTELLNAMRVIGDQCEKFCAGCPIEEECLKYFDGFPCDWDLEEGESDD